MIMQNTERGNSVKSKEKTSVQKIVSRYIVRYLIRLNIKPIDIEIDEGDKGHPISFIYNDNEILQHALAQYDLLEDELKSRMTR